MFRNALASGAPSSQQDGTTPTSRPGRPGLQLDTEAALARVYELWPQLAAADPKAIFEEAVARTARQLAAAIGPLVREEHASVPEAPKARQDYMSPVPAEDWQRRIEEQLSGLQRDLTEVRREMAQFSAMRNNLVVRLDEVVARSRDLTLAAGSSAAGADPIVEARRDRDMALIKSTLERILDLLERS